MKIRTYLHKFPSFNYHKPIQLGDYSLRQWTEAAALWPLEADNMLIRL
jgi:hypothetical protein